MNTGIFPPAKREGLLVHGALMLLAAVVAGVGFWRLSSTTGGPAFVLYLLLGVLGFAPIPLLGYRAYALLKAQYRLDRNSLELRWGLRNELVPLGEIEWVRAAKDLVRPIGLPAIHMPGAILGLRRHPDLGVIEFLASRSKDLLLVAVRDRVYAISPAAPADFVATFAAGSGTRELAGGRTEVTVSVICYCAGMAIRLSPLYLVGGAVPQHWFDGVDKSLDPGERPFRLGVSAGRHARCRSRPQLVIVPLVSALLSLTAWISGLFLYRWKKRRVPVIDTVDIERRFERLVSAGCPVHCDDSRVARARCSC